MKKLLIPAIVAVLVIAGIAMTCGGGSQEETDGDSIIVIRKPKAVEAKGPFTTRQFDRNEPVHWLDKDYSVQIGCHADSALAQVEYDGRMYYDNRISVKVVRPDGSVFFDRVFTKESFSAYMPAESRSRFVLLSIIEDARNTTDEALVLSAAVGEPDDASDLATPLSIFITPQGEVTVRKANLMDDSVEEGSPQQQSDDGGMGDGV